MKIVVFAPHGDDELYAAGGSILKWLDEGHELHLVYVTDNRAWFEWGINEGDLVKELAEPYKDLTGDEMARICIKESKDVLKALDIPTENAHFFHFPDQEASDNVKEGITLAKRIMKDADRVVMSSDNNSHVDHQATHAMAKQAGIDLNLDIEYYVYAVYDLLNVPREQQIKIKVVEYRDKKYEIMKLYKTQLCLETMRLGWENFKRKRYERFGLFRIDDAGKFDNF